MKSTALMTIPKAEITKVTRKHSVKPYRTAKELAERDDVVDKLWDMYDKQLKRIHQLMETNHKLQEEIEELKRRVKLIGENVPNKKPKEEKEKKLEAIGYDRLTALTKIMKGIFQSEIKRTAHANALVHMLYTLYQLKGQATPDQLFASADVTQVTGFRYTSFLKTARLIEFSPTNKKGIYELTETGKLFIEGKVITMDDYCNLTATPKTGKFYVWGKDAQHSS